MIYVALVLSILAMAAIATWAHRNIAPETSRLPMQWSASGTVNWRAPRLVAIAATPVLMLALMVVIFILSRNDLAERNMALLWLAFLGPPLQAVHMALVARTVENED